MRLNIFKLNHIGVGRQIHLKVRRRHNVSQRWHTAVQNCRRPGIRANREIAWQECKLLHNSSCCHTMPFTSISFDIIVEIIMSLSSIFYGPERTMLPPFSLSSGILVSHSFIHWRFATPIGGKKEDNEAHNLWWQIFDRILIKGLRRHHQQIHTTRRGKGGMDGNRTFNSIDFCHGNFLYFPLLHLVRWNKARRMSSSFQAFTHWLLGLNRLVSRIGIY